MVNQLVAYKVNDYQKIAKLKLPTDLYEYLASGTDDEQTLAENESSFKRWYLMPRVMRPVGRLSTKISLFGKQVETPVFVSPAGVQALCDPQGECATARACGKMGILFGLSQHATRSIEQVARGAPDTLRWYQAYILKDRDLTRRLVRRAIAAGYQGIFLTVDSVRFGYREADARNGFTSLPAPHRLANYDEDAQTMENTYNGKKKRAWDQNSEMMFEQNVTWKDATWLKKQIGDLPLVLKGVLTPQDALLAIEAGADGIMVSNHGGRQLDGALASIDALPAIAHVVAGRVPILLDGGVRRGTDVLKALALGASAVGIGKPVFFSLAVNGEEGVLSMLRLLQTEIEAAMAICGLESIADITTELVARGDPSRDSHRPAAVRFARSNL
mmetsp:Transcript_27795/g.40949  ORF Transcript_27795/g.40949 Transcript_27795/m.40949 type:complete len:387 (-) Transcript_27795:1597-2757(-)